jgi:hypothetical protein
VKRQQFILAATGLLLLIAIYFFGQTTPPRKMNAMPEANSSGTVVKPVTTADILQSFKAKLTPGQLSHVTSLENSVVRGDVKNQQLICN